MLYYRVKDEFDNYTKYRFIGKNRNVFNIRKTDKSDILIGGELYTPREREKIANCDKFFDKVYISKRRVYFVFGARFECGRN